MVKLLSKSTFQFYKWKTNFLSVSSLTVIYRSLSIHLCMQFIHCNCSKWWSQVIVDDETGRCLITVSFLHSVQCDSSTHQCSGVSVLWWNLLVVMWTSCWRVTFCNAIRHWDSLVILTLLYVNVYMPLNLRSQHGSLSQLHPADDDALLSWPPSACDAYANNKNVAW